MAIFFGSPQVHSLMSWLISVLIAYNYGSYHSFAIDHGTCYYRISIIFIVRPFNENMIIIGLDQGGEGLRGALQTLQGTALLGR